MVLAAGTVECGVPPGPLVPVEGINSATAVGAAGGHACALLEGSRVRCWGENEHGQLGDGSFVAAWTPVDVPHP